jgi:hypothetical protein
MMEVLYTKYNYQRLPEFQVATSIVLDQGRKQVFKRALVPAARAHLARVRQEHLQFAAAAGAGGFELPGLRDAGEGALACDFIEGPSLDDLLFQAFQAGDRDRFWASLDEYVRRLRTGFQTVAQPPPEGQAEIERVFGRAAFPWVTPAPDAFLARAAIDLIFDNVIVVDARWLLVDNEWVFPGCVPVAYVLYRALFEFYELKWREFGIERFIPFPAAARRYGIDDQAAAAYREMEDRFQAYVCGEQRLHFNLRYLKPVETIPRLQETVARQARTIQDQDLELRELRVKAGVLAEIQRSAGYRLLNRVCRGLDRVFPPGSRRRRWVGGPLRKLLSLIGLKNK